MQDKVRRDGESDANLQQNLLFSPIYRYIYWISLHSPLVGISFDFVTNSFDIFVIRTYVSMMIEHILWRHMRT